MRSVAELAGVSLKTVARVVNRELGVSPDLRERVNRAVEELGYVKPAARSTRRAPSRAAFQARTISVLVDHLSFPFQAAVTDSIQGAAYARGYLTLVSATGGDAELETAIIEAHLKRGVRGLIIAPSAQGADYMRELVTTDLSVVFIDRSLPDVPADSVAVDNVGGAESAVQELIEHGHRRIAVFGTDSSLDTALERHLGYKNALLRAGHAVDPALVKLQVLRAGVVRAELEALARLQDPPTALFALSGSYMTQIIQNLRPEAGIALAGFDEIPLADSLHHGLTVVAQHPEAMGQAAVDLLFRRLDGDDTPPKRILIGTDLIARASSKLVPRPLHLSDLRPQPATTPHV